MPAVESLPNNIRRMAVLVASVDAATARQLLLQLPTEIAKQVRGALQNLGPIDPFERQRIIAEFQSTAARQARSVPHSSTSQHANSQNSASQNSASHSSFAHGSSTQVADQQPLANSNRLNQVPQPSAQYSRADVGQNVGVVAHLSEHSGAVEHTGKHHYSNQSFDNHHQGPQSTESETRSAWKRMDTRALSRLLAGERPTVIAVVISQLSPEAGVALLQQLPTGLHRDVLKRIVHLQDIDAEAMQSIDDHLAERLKDYEHEVNSEAESTRRISSLIAVAPPVLQQAWIKLLRESNAEEDEDQIGQIQAGLQQTTTSAVAMSAVQTNASVASSSAANAEMFDTANLAVNQTQTVTPTASTAATSAIDQLGSQIVVGGTVQSVTPNNATPQAVNVQSTGPDILPFPGAYAAPPLSNADRGLLQVEFERLLQLGAQKLAKVLTTADSQTVLLSLAGASPAFMKRFYTLLTKQDAKILAARLSQIGPLRLRDIDEAQQRIVELAAKLFAPPIKRDQLNRAAA